MSPVSAPASAPMAMPASSSVPTISWPWRPATETRMSVDSEAAEEGRERQRIDAEQLHPGRGQRVAQRDGRHGRERRARRDTDQARGRPSGLRNRPCIMAPATASEAPTKAPSSVRGNAQVDQDELLACDGRHRPTPVNSRDENTRQRRERDAGRPDRQRQDHRRGKQRDTARDQQPATRLAIHHPGSIAGAQHVRPHLREPGLPQCRDRPHASDPRPQPACGDRSPADKGHP